MANVDPQLIGISSTDFCVGGASTNNSTNQNIQNSEKSSASVGVVSNSVIASTNSAENLIIVDNNSNINRNNNSPNRKNMTNIEKKSSTNINISNSSLSGSVGGSGVGGGGGSASSSNINSNTIMKKTQQQKKSTNTGNKKPSHPPTSEMVVNSIKTLKERGGSSLQAIKKFISANYKVDGDKLAPFIKKYLKAAVISGQLIQTKGKGASGSFKLASSATIIGRQQRRGIVSGGTGNSGVLRGGKKVKTTKRLSGSIVRKTLAADTKKQKRQSIVGTKLLSKSKTTKPTGKITTKKSPKKVGIKKLTKRSSNIGTDDTAVATASLTTSPNLTKKSTIGKSKINKKLSSSSGGIQKKSKKTTTMKKTRTTIKKTIDKNLSTAKAVKALATGINVGNISPTTGKSLKKTTGKRSPIKKPKTKTSPSKKTIVGVGGISTSKRKK